MIDNGNELIYTASTKFAVGSLYNCCFRHCSISSPVTPPLISLCFSSPCQGDRLHLFLYTHLSQSLSLPPTLLGPLVSSAGSISSASYLPPRRRPNLHFTLVVTTLDGGLIARKTLPQAPKPRPPHGSMFLDEFVLRVLRDGLFPTHDLVGGWCIQCTSSPLG